MLQGNPYSKNPDLGNTPLGAHAVQTQKHGIVLAHAVVLVPATVFFSNLGMFCAMHVPRVR